MKNLRIGLKWSALIIGASVFVIFGSYLYNLLFPTPVPPSQNEINASISEAMASATSQPPYSSVVYQAILPSLVLIQTQFDVEVHEHGYGVGSGVIINEDGDILTANHVVADASKIEIYFADGSMTLAEIIFAQPEIDIAVVHPQQAPSIIVPAVLGNVGAMRVGDEAYAIGNPLGLVASMSAGVISAFDRSIPITQDLKLEGLIQFDTPVNPGSSGGPLLNRKGEVVGIVTALANPSEQNFFVGIGFAVPISTAVSAAGGPGY